MLKFADTGRAKSNLAPSKIKLDANTSKTRKLSKSGIYFLFHCVKHQMRQGWVNPQSTSTFFDLSRKLVGSLFLLSTPTGSLSLMDLIDELENDLLELDEQHQKHQQKDHSTGLEENEDGHNQLHVASGEEYKDELRRAATFYYSGKLEELQSDIVAFEGQKDNAEESQELLSRAISALEQSEQEITDIHSLINSKFSKFIPELSTLVPSIKEYVKAVEIIINKEDLSELKKFVSNNGVFLVLSIQLKNSPFDLGKDVPANDRAFILDGCLVIEKLFAFNELVVSYLEKIMIFLCPNIVCLVGKAFEFLVLMF